MKKIFNTILMITTISLCCSNVDKISNKIDINDNIDNYTFLNEWRSKILNNKNTINNISYVDNYIEQYYYSDNNIKLWC